MFIAKLHGEQRADEYIGLLKRKRNEEVLKELESLKSNKDFKEIEWIRNSSKGMKLLKTATQKRSCVLNTAILTYVALICKRIYLCATRLQR